MNPRALIIDDEPAECELFADALKHAGFDSDWVKDGQSALDVLAKRPFDVVVTDLNMPTMTGTELCRRVKDVLPHLPVVVVTAFGSIDGAVEAMRAGAYDFVTKPFDVDAIGLVLRRAVEHHALRWEVDALRRVADTSQRFGELIGTSESMRRLYDSIARVAESDEPLVVTGETGSGKEIVAREVHARGRRAAEPFVTVNCAAVPEALLEGEIFGQEPSARTAPAQSRNGLVQAVRGSIFLDEIAELPLVVQSKLLEAMQERRFRPVGSTREVDFNARVVAATNKDMVTAVEQGLFREDLYLRLNALHLEVPPLRARAGDVLLLAQTFLGEIAVRNGKIVTGFTAQAAERLVRYDWPGNVRELRSCIERAVTLAQSELVDLVDLPARVRDYEPAHVVVVADDPNEIISLEEVERRYILKVVDACKGNKSKAARALGIGRKTLYRRLESFGVSVSDEESG